jgi:hypothetical protein
MGYIVKLADYGLSFVDVYNENKLYKIRPSYILATENRKILTLNPANDISHYFAKFINTDKNKFSIFLLLITFRLEF